MTALGRAGRRRRPATGAGVPAWSLRRRLGALFVVTAVIATAAVVLTVASFAGLLDARSTVIDQVNRADVAARDLFAALVDQEDKVRGILLAPDQGVELFRRAEADTAAAHAQLAGLTRSDPGLVAGLAAIDRAVAEWTEVAVAPVLDGDAPPLATVSAFLAATEERFDQVRAGVDALTADLARRRVDAIDRLDDATQLLALILGGTGVAVLAAGAGVWLALRRWVTDPLLRLGADAGQVAAGDLLHPVTPAGPSELAALGGAMEAMRSRVVDELQSVQAAQAELDLKAEELAGSNRELDEQAAELARSNAELEQFAYVASHDLQEPLRKVSSFCQLLSERYGGQLDDRADQYIAFAVDGAKRMQALISDLLAFSRAGRDRDRFRLIALEETLRAALNNIEVAITEAGAEITVDPLPTVVGDPTLLVALFQNLVTNAVKFRGDERPTVRITVEATEGGWAFAVADNGIGIEPDYAERVFGIFERLHSRDDYSGTGIGLALCRKIVESHDGRIWVDPSVPAGTTIRFSLPAVEPAVPIAGVAEVSRGEPVP
ncbi:MAG: sensor histidine kinase [Acidimicrobiia bacterium]